MLNSVKNGSRNPLMLRIAASLMLLLASSLGGVVLHAQNITVKGTVFDAKSGETIPFASIVLKGGNMVGTSTDAEGAYSLSVPSKGTLVFSSIGYESLEVEINGKLVINAELKPSVDILSESVVVAYGVATKESLTGAVASVDSKAIEKRPVTSAASALEGMTSGVQINNTNGEPGSTPTIRIRGFSTINGDNSPLYVVDGVPLSGSTADINPNDIESMSILKDAASAALYGNRAANGVVLITTKRGSSERIRLRITANQGVYTRGLQEYDRMDANEWMETQYKAMFNSFISTPSYKGKYSASDGTARAVTLEQLPDRIGYNIYNKSWADLFDENGKIVPGAEIKSQIKGDLDWYKPIERWGHRQEYNISGDGATDKSNYFVSANYLQENGYVTTSDLERLTARANASVTPVKWFTMGINISASHNKSNYTSTSSSTGYANPFYFARNMAPIYPIYAHDLDSPDGAFILDENGDKVFDWGQFITRPQNNGRNKVYEGLLDRDMYEKTTMDTRANATLNLPFGFKFNTTAQYYLSESKERTYNNAILGDGAASKGRGGLTEYWYNNIHLSEQLTWDRDFDVHHVDVMLGHENYSRHNTYSYIYKLGETFANNYNLNNFSETSYAYDYQNNYRTEGYIARARYNYDNKYFAEASYRRDGSSRFAPEKRWGNFWSVGGSWIISREPWMHDLSDKINALKLRASYGEVGNDQSVGTYAYMGLYTLSSTNAEKIAAYKTQNDAPDIVWESTNSLGIALEGRVFDRVNFTLEYFDKRSKDLLFDVYLPLSAGSTDTGVTYAYMTQNLGTISNRGIEFSADVDLIKTRDFKWNFGANATWLRNRIVTLPEQNREEGIISGTKKYVEGGGIYDYWLYDWVGVDQMTGESLFTINTEKYCVGTPEEGSELAQIPAEYVRNVAGKDYTTYTTYAVKDWAGKANPDVYGSFNTSFSYKNISLSAIFTYALGGKVYDNSYASLMSTGVSALHKDLLKAWDGVPAGITESSPDRISKNVIPVVDNYLDTYTYGGSSNRWLHDGSYLVFKNLSLSYSLGHNFCEKIGVNNASLSLSGENLFTLTHLRGMDPQQSFSGTTGNYFMTARVYSLGLNITL